MLVDLRNVATVTDGSWGRFWSTDGVTGVYWFYWKLVGEMEVFGHDWVLLQWLADRSICTISYYPDWSWSQWRCGTLPERASKDDNLAWWRERLRHWLEWLGVLDCQAGIDQLSSDNILLCSVQGETELFESWMCKVDCVNCVPDLAQRGSTGSSPLEGGFWASAGSRIRGVIRRRWALMFELERQFKP